MSLSRFSTCWLPSNSTISFLSKDTKSTMYSPIGCCLRNFVSFNCFDLRCRHNNFSASVELTLRFFANCVKIGFALNQSFFTLTLTLPIQGEGIKGYPWPLFHLPSPRGREIRSCPFPYYLPSPCGRGRGRGKSPHTLTNTPDSSHLPHHLLETYFFTGVPLVSSAFPILPHTKRKFLSIISMSRTV